MTFQIRTTSSTNQGTPLYVVIKETKMVNFLVEDYNKIATQSFWKDEDPSKLIKKVLVPGKTHKIKLKPSDPNQSVGIYFLFTNPGESWKYIIDQPKSQKVKVLLGKDEYEAINVFNE